MGYLDHIGLGHLWSKVNAKLTGKQDKLTGRPGQTIGFCMDGTAAAQSGWSNPNLLDNWYLADPIDQKGQHGYVISARKYAHFIDRWRGTASISFHGDGIRLENTLDVDGLWWLLQWFGTDRIQDGDTVTASALVRISPAVRPNVQLRFWDTGRFPGYAVVPKTGAYELLSFTTKKGPCETADKRDGIGLVSDTCANSGSGCKSFLDLKAIKLELGRSQTLAHQDEDGTWVLNDPPPDKALELAKCQRYYQIFTDKALRPTRAADFRPPMRVDPALGTIDIGGTTYYTADANL